MSGMSQLQHTTPRSSYHEQNSGTPQRSPWKRRMTFFSRPSRNPYEVQMPFRKWLCSSSSICGFLASLLQSLWGLQSIWLPPGLVQDLLSVLIGGRVLPRLSTYLPFSQEATWPFTLFKRIISLEQWEEHRREGEQRVKKKSHMYWVWIICQVQCWVVSQMFLFAVTLTHGEIESPFYRDSIWLPKVPKLIRCRLECLPSSAHHYNLIILDIAQDNSSRSIYGMDTWM